MRTAIISFHHTTNFGATLQVFATQQYIESLGIESTILDYRNECIENMEFSKLKLKGLTVKSIVSFLLTHPAQKKKGEALFNFLRCNSKVSSRMNQEELHAIEDKYDFFISGSDIIWCLDKTGNDYTYFLDFVHDSNKKISYASSFGKEPDKNNLEQVSKLLKEYQAVSTREQEGIEIVRNITNKKAVLVCDPTMLLENEIWVRMADASTAMKSKYILIYFLNLRGKMLDDAKKLAKKWKIDVVVIHCGRPIKGVKTVWPTTPQEFLNLIRNAQVVLTGSYHGLLFSMYFHKIFYFYANNMKIKNLVTLFEIEKQDGEKFDINNVCVPDYENIDLRIEELRSVSREYLRKSLSL